MQTTNLSYRLSNWAKKPNSVAHPRPYWLPDYVYFYIYPGDG